MPKTFAFIITLAIFAIVSSHAPLTSCPTGIAPLDFYTDAFTISSSKSSPIRLVNGQDVTCYNYSLPTPFLNEPTLALAINGFQSNKSCDIFFSIKPVWSFQFVQIPFQVRTQWKYTSWIKVSVNFLIESRKDIQTGFYQRDTGLVGTCGTFKSQPIFLPFVTKWTPNQKNLTVRVFIHGFQISSQKGSPYEIRLTSFSYNNTGINARIVVNSTTIVNSVYLSYIVFQTNNFGLRNINGFIEKVTNQKSFSQPILSRNFQVFKNYLYGISGFVFDANNQIFLDINIGENFLANFNFNNQLYNYIGFQYILFGHSPCQRCVGFPFTHNGQCLKACPADTLVIGDNTCFSCPSNSFNHEGRCICKQGFYNISGACTKCPIGQIFSNGVCTGCGKNALWVGNLCQCNIGYYNISGVCTQCPKNTFWNGMSCAGCGQNSYFFAGVCQCQPGFYNISGICNKCPTGTIFNGKNCVLPCRPGEVWTGSKCLSLCQKIPNSYWNGIQCICTQGFYNITNKCSKCEGNLIWNGNRCDQARRNDNDFFVSFAGKSGKATAKEDSNQKS